MEPLTLYINGPSCVHAKFVTFISVWTMLLNLFLNCCTRGGLHVCNVLIRYLWKWCRVSHTQRRAGVHCTDALSYHFSFISFILIWFYTYIRTHVCIFEIYQLVFTVVNVLHTPHDTLPRYRTGQNSKVRTKMCIFLKPFLPFPL